MMKMHGTDRIGQMIVLRVKCVKGRRHQRWDAVLRNPTMTLATARFAERTDIPDIAIAVA